MAHLAGLAAGAFTAATVSPALSGAVGQGVTDFGLSIRGSPDAMTAGDINDPDQQGMRDWDASQFDTKGEPDDYSETEGDRIVEERLKVARPCAPGERGWPECAEEEEDDVLTGIARYLDQLQKREAQDPYKGQEELFKRIYGENWRERLARRDNT